tara:strand:+ start:970 stop:1194 length:225 start_codon:yes stop_codon:yes gene_type:complete
MKKLTTLLFATLLCSCSVNTSGNVNFKGEDLKYFKDSRTNLCFAVVGSRKAATLEITGLGVTCVPCENVEHLIK